MAQGRHIYGGVTMTALLKYGQEITREAVRAAYAGAAVRVYVECVDCGARTTTCLHSGSGETVPAVMCDHCARAEDERWG